MMEATEHVYPTLGEYVSEMHAPVLAGKPRERIVRCRDCRHSARGGYECWHFKSYVQVDEYEWEDVPADVEPDGFCKWGEDRVMEI